ncbi:hypothetical protein PTKIN_Ptkin14bG0125500 [Pterospermum kingtungense]
MAWADLAPMGKECAEKGLMLLWAIWNSRNTEVKQGRKVPAPSIIAHAWDYLNDFVKSQNLHEEQERWRAPPVGTIKINFDGATRLSTGTGGIGALARDWIGAFLGAVQATLPDKTDPRSIRSDQGLRLCNSRRFLMHRA